MASYSRPRYNDWTKKLHGAYLGKRSNGNYGGTIRATKYRRGGTQDNPVAQAINTVAQNVQYLDAQAGGQAGRVLGAERKFVDYAVRS